MPMQINEALAKLALLGYSHLVIYYQQTSRLLNNSLRPLRASGSYNIEVGKWRYTEHIRIDLATEGANRDKELQNKVLIWN